MARAAASAIPRVSVRIFRIDDLVEVALGTFPGHFLVEHREPFLVQLLEELFPGDLPKICVVRVRRGRELNAHNAGAAVRFS